MVCVRIVWWIFWRGIVFGALMGALVGTFVMPIVGTLYGLFYGAIIGTIMGAITAFALGATAHFFMDMDRPSRIIPWLRLIGITLNLIGVGIYLLVLFGLDIAAKAPIFFIAPPILAAIVVYLLCPRFVDFAVRIQQDTPAHILATPQTHALNQNHSLP